MRTEIPTRIFIFPRCCVAINHLFLLQQSSNETFTISPGVGQRHLLNRKSHSLKLPPPHTHTHIIRDPLDYNVSSCPDELTKEATLTLRWNSFSVGSRGAPVGSGRKEETSHKDKSAYRPECFHRFPWEQEGRAFGRLRIGFRVKLNMEDVEDAVGTWPGLRLHVVVFFFYMDWQPGLKQERHATLLQKSYYSFLQHKNIANSSSDK